MSFKVAVKVVGENTPSYNGIRLATVEEAEAYAGNLMSRWMLMTGYTIEESEDVVNYQWVNGGLVSVGAK